MTIKAIQGSVVAAMPAIAVVGLAMLLQYTSGILQLVVGLSAVGLTLLVTVKSCVKFLGKDEQLRIQGMTDLVIQNGPGTKILIPFTYRSAEVIKAETLGTTDYVKVKDSIEGTERIERGPKLLFLGAYEKVETRAVGISLGQTDYVTIQDKSTGELSIKRGPGVWFPGPQDVGTKGFGISLSSTEYVLIEDKLSGQKRVEKGPSVWFPEPLEKGAKGSAFSLGSTEYVLITDKQTGQKRVETGPRVWFPGAWESATTGSGISLGKTEYVLVVDALTGKKSIVKGPSVWFPGPHESGTQGDAVSLSDRQYIHVEDQLTGVRRLVKGPVVWFPDPYDLPSTPMSACALQADEYIKLKEMTSGKRWVQKGKALVFLEPSWTIEAVGAKGYEFVSGSASKINGAIRKAWVLKAYEYVRLLDSVTGKVTMTKGEDTVFPGPDEVLLDRGKMAAEDLEVNEYVKVLDQSTGQIRVVGGPAQVMLEPHEKFLDGGRQKAVEVDDEHAVLVRDKGTGQVRLVTENQLFVPAPHEKIEKIQELIKLADHEALILKDSEGLFTYYYGSDAKRAADQPRSFFLPPYSEIVTLRWSRGRKRETRDLLIDRFDLRAQYMSFEFSCRTKDNVELVLEGTFFWEVVDLPLMVQTTGDTSGDICLHARSQFIKHVAQATLKELMDDLAGIASRVFKEDAHFYASRGVKVHSLEVTRYACTDVSTSEVLAQIIQETTNRMNRLSQAESENEVHLFRMQGEIEQERLNGELIEIQHGHMKIEATVQGSAEADGIAAFIDGLDKEVPRLQDRMAMWQTLRKTDALTAVAQGGASLYYTPNDVNLSIETRTVPESGPLKR